MSLRYFDGTNNAWYDSLNLPATDKDYVVPIRYTDWRDVKLRTINARCDLFNDSYVLNTYDVFALTYEHLDPVKHVLVTEDMRLTHPLICS